MIKIDVHQHVWTEPLLQALSARRELPYLRCEQGLHVLYLAGERPYVIDLASETSARRAALVELDGLDRALLCLSSPVGIEALSRDQSQPILDAYHDGALALGGPFGVWGAVALDDPDPADVDRALARGCVGVSLPADALAGVERVARLSPLLARLELHGAPLFVHPGPGSDPSRAGSVAASSLAEPLWWPALTRYVAGMHAAWLAFLAAGRSRHPQLRVVFAMLAGMAPLQAERLSSRGGPASWRGDPLVFYDTSSYGPTAVRAIEEIVGPQQLLYGSDRPVVEPESRMVSDLDWSAVADGTRRALGASSAAAAR
jgi:6-methylsalicylate decarboxylase